MCAMTTMSERSNTFQAANQRAKCTLREAIRSKKVPKPTECDGCGKGGAFRQFIYSPFDPFNFSSYCADCWLDHGLDQRMLERRERYEAELAPILEMELDAAEKGYKLCSGFKRDAHHVVLENFFANPHRKDGLDTRCKSCKRAAGNGRWPGGVIGAEPMVRGRSSW